MSIEGYCEEISIHAPTRGATLLSFSKFDRASISIHAPTRGATCIKKKGTSHKFNFNPRSHERSDLYQKKGYFSQIQFQSTLPREERQRTVLYRTCGRYFNPRSHERSDIVHCNCFKYIGISIHAPTRGATFQQKGGRGGSQYFNPRSHERSDHYTVQQCWRLLISIHAPTRGATSWRRL